VRRFKFQVIPLTRLQNVGFADRLQRLLQDTPTTQMRKIIAKRLLESKLTLPHSYMAIEIEMDSLMATRAKFNQQNSTKVVPA
jgi:pyruvate/2-oxoglutarate dehydrogenase complex dihydrolipoamide acyltransferase (E2) component